MNKLTAMRHDAYAFASFDIALSFPSVQETLEVLIRTSRIDQVTLHLKQPGKINSTYSWSTFPGKWISRYYRQSYALYDPIINIGFSKKEPFFLSDLKVRDNEKLVLEDAARHGIGPNGYCIPLTKEENSAIIVVFSQNMKNNDWKYYIKSIEHELRQFSKSIHSRSIEEFNTEAAPTLS